MAESPGRNSANQNRTIPRATNGDEELARVFYSLLVAMSQQLQAAISRTSLNTNAYWQRGSVPANLTTHGTPKV